MLVERHNWLWFVFLKGLKSSSEKNYVFQGCVNIILIYKLVKCLLLFRFFAVLFVDVLS